ncbi:MAG: regulator of polyketide synthase expression [Clostridia bacterium]|jgi:GGDEF domain-containing protein|nr:regulator of polyketide synthase expression [Clostridia bacterium]
MAITIKDIMKLHSLSKVKLLAGKEALGRYVRWVYVAECLDDPLESIAWLQGGELVFISGLGIKHNKEILLSLIKGISEKNGAGLIINIGRYIEEVPEEVIKAADELDLPVFELPWEVKLVELTHEICSSIVLSEFEDNSLTHLLSSILFGEGDPEGNIIERAAYFGYNLSGECGICVIDIDEFAKYIENNSISEEQEIVRIKSVFMKVVQEALEYYHIKALLLAQSDSVIILNKASGKGSELLQKVIERIQQAVETKWKGMTVSIGIGNRYNDLSLMKRSLMEAEWALKAAKIKGEKRSVTYVADIGIYALLFNIKDKEILKQFYFNNLGRVLEYDKINDACLIATLEMYLSENCNITTTAEKLFLHRNTLKYRLKKIEELLNCNLHNLNDCVELQTALEIGKLICKV